MIACQIVWRMNDSRGQVSKLLKLCMGHIKASYSIISYFCTYDILREHAGICA